MGRHINIRKICYHVGRIRLSLVRVRPSWQLAKQWRHLVFNKVGTSLHRQRPTGSSQHHIRLVGADTLHLFRVKHTSDISHNAI